MNDASAPVDAEGGRGRSVFLSRLSGGVRRRWRWIVWPTLAAAVASTAFVLVASPRYTGVAQVLLNDQESHFTRAGKAPGLEPAATIDPDAAQSEAEAAISTDLARQAVEKLGLASNPEFNSAINAGSGGKADQQLVDKFLSRLTASAAPRSHVLQIEFVSRDPELAARGANTVAEVLVRSRAEAKANTAKAASERLSRRIEDLRAKAADADAKVEAFRAQSGLLGGANGRTAPAQELSDLNTQLANARSAEASATAKTQLLRKLQREGRLDEAPASIVDESMRRFIEARVALQAEIADASRTLLPLHPHMKELAARLAGLDAQIRDAAARNVRALDNDAKLAADQVASLSAALAEQSRAVANGNADNARLRALETEAKAARDRLESDLQNYREAADADNAAPADARIIAMAEPPRLPTFPKAWRTVLLATLGTFVCSTGVAAAAALASGESTPGGRSVPASPPLNPAPPPPLVRPQKRREDEAAPEPAALGPPEPRLTEAEVALAGSALDGADALARRLARLKRKDAGLTALVAGTGSGRALALALETARRLAAQGPTLLLDLGATQSWLGDILDREETDGVEVPGLADLIAGRASYGEVIRRDLSSSLDVIPAGGEVEADKLADVFAAVSAAYGCVILHASDWRSPEARSAAEAADAVVVAAPKARLVRTIERATKTLSDACPNIVAFAEAQPKSALEEAA